MSHKFSPYSYSSLLQKTSISTREYLLWAKILLMRLSPQLPRGKPQYSKRSVY